MDDKGVILSKLGCFEKFELNTSSERVFHKMKKIFQFR